MDETEADERCRSAGECPGMEERAQSFMEDREDSAEADKRCCAGDGIDIEERVQSFMEDREAQRRMRVRRMQRAGFFMVSIGSLFVGVGMALRGVAPAWSLICQSLGFFYAASSFVTLTALPMADLDDLLARNPRSRSALWAGLATYGALRITAAAPGVWKAIWAPRVPLCLWGLVAGCWSCRRRPCGLHCPQQTTHITAVALVSLLEAIASQVHMLWRAGCGLELSHCSPAMVSGACAVGLAGYSLWQRRRQPAGRDAELAPTLTVYYTCVGCLLVAGACWFLSGAVAMVLSPPCLEWKEQARGEHLGAALNGLALLLPGCVAVALRRGRCPGAMARSFERAFERSRAVQDGAFLAALLDSVALQEGGVWWVHHGRNDPSYAEHDARRNWVKGEITKITDDEMIVVCRDDAGSKNIEHHLQISMRGCSSEELMQNARDSLRCITWPDIVAHKEELFFGSGATTQANVLNSLTGGNLFAYSRPLRKNEQIDFFLSHSWHDDTTKKWARLEEFAHAFEEDYNRALTFWIDNVCIDQTRVNENLKMLPISLMSCAQILVISGRTYPHRLWCAWELLTLLAFSSEDQAMDRVMVLTLDEGPEFDALAALEAFSVGDARCYDPNEEARLRMVIQAVGEDRFNVRIQTLAKAIREREMCTMSSRSVSSVGSTAPSVVPRFFRLMI